MVTMKTKRGDEEAQAARNRRRPAPAAPQGSPQPALTICSADTTFCMVDWAAKPTATVEMEPKASRGWMLMPKQTSVDSTAATRMPCERGRVGRLCNRIRGGEGPGGPQGAGRMARPRGTPARSCDCRQPAGQPPAPPHPGRHSAERHQHALQLRVAAALARLHALQQRPHQLVLPRDGKPGADRRRAGAAGRGGAGRRRRGTPPGALGCGAEAVASAHPRTHRQPHPQQHSMVTKGDTEARTNKQAGNKTLKAQPLTRRR